MMLFTLGRLLQGRIARCFSRLATLWAPGREPSGFWRIRWSTECHQKGREPPADTIGRGLLGFEPTFPGQSPVRDAGTSQAQLRIGRHNQPGPEISLLRMANPRCRPVQRLLEEADGVLHVEPVDVGPPKEGQVGAVGP